LQIERERRGQKQNDEERGRLYGERGYLGDVRVAGGDYRRTGIGLAQIVREEIAGNLRS
jgi:hypothetical protein